MEEEKKYSEWEYEEIPDQGDDDQNNDPNANQGDPNADDASNSSMSDDTPVEIDIDGKKETVTLGELRGGYMRHADYTRKSQEVAEMRKKFETEEGKKVVEKAREVVENPNDFNEDDVKIAEHIVKIAKAKFGLMTKDEYEADRVREKQVSEFSSKLESAKSEVEKMTASYQDNGKTIKVSMPAWDEEKVLNHMQESGIHNPIAAYKDLYEAEYRDFIIKQSKGDTSYKSDKGGKKPEPKEKVINVHTEEGHRSFLADELAKLKG